MSEPRSRGFVGILVWLATVAAVVVPYILLYSDESHLVINNRDMRFQWTPAWLVLAIVFLASIYLFGLAAGNAPKASMKPAQGWQRALSFFVDWHVYVGLLSSVVMTAFGIAESVHAGELVLEVERKSDLSGVFLLVYVAACMIFTLPALFALPVWRQRMSPGNTVAGIVVVSDEDGMTFRSALWRSYRGIPMVLVWPFMLFFLRGDKPRLSHDERCGTSVYMQAD